MKKEIEVEGDKKKHEYLKMDKSKQCKRRKGREKTVVDQKEEDKEKVEEEEKKITKKAKS